MFNEDYKKTVIRDLEKADKEYTLKFKNATNDIIQLFNTRCKVIRTIQNVERYVTQLANRPRKYDTEIGEIRLRYVKFQNKMKEIQKIDEKEREIHRTDAAGIGGALVGVGTVAFAPSAAMAVAMTFGTASTGTAIASLSGVAATNAALAWLGGGTLAAGGAGVIGGEAMLTMAGPIGWAIGGTAIASSLILKSRKNKEIAEESEKSIRVIKKEAERIQEIDVQVLSWKKETIKLSNKLSKQLNQIKMTRKRDYDKFTDDEINELCILMNMTEVLSKKIGETIK